jgi:hypothetical protein
MDDLARMFRHALRPRILVAVDRQGEASPADVARMIGAPLESVSYHVKVLHRSGWLVLARIERRHGGRRHVYRVAAPPFIDDPTWERLPRGVRRGLTHQALQQVLQTSTAALKAGGFDDAGAHVDRLALRLDADGARELSALLTRALTDSRAIQARSSARDAPESLLVILHYWLRDSGSSGG